MIVEQSSNSLFERPSTSDLEDLNRTLYDIGAQDLLDVWQAMESEVSECMHQTVWIPEQSQNWNGCQWPKRVFYGGRTSVTYILKHTSLFLHVKSAQQTFLTCYIQPSLMRTRLFMPLDWLCANSFWQKMTCELHPWLVLLFLQNLSFLKLHIPVACVHVFMLKPYH